MVFLDFQIGFGADKRVTDLTVQTEPIASGDKLVNIDVSDINDNPAGSSKQLSWAQIVEYLDTLFATLNSPVLVTPNIGDATGTSLTLSGVLTAESLELSPPPSGSTGEMYVPEDPDNGTNIVGFKSPVSLASDTFWVLPNVVGGAGDGFRLTGDTLAGYPVLEMYHLPVTTISTEQPSGGVHGDVWYVVQ